MILLGFVTWFVCVFAQRMPAATLTVIPRVVRALDPVSFEDVEIMGGVLPGEIVPPQERALAYEVEFHVTVANLDGPPNELGLAAVGFNILLDGGLTQNSVVPAWRIAQGPRALAEQPPPLPPVPKWNCTDCTTFDDDLQQIVVGTSPLLFGEIGVDPRWRLGQGPFPGDEPGEFMGTLFVDWDGASMATLSVDVFGFIVINDRREWAFADGNTLGGQVLFGVPEPATGTLAVVAMLMGALLSFSRRRRR